MFLGSVTRRVAAVAAAAVCAACSSATEGVHGLGLWSAWPAETLLLAGSSPGPVLGPVAVALWGRDTLLLSDAVSARLVAVDLSGRRAWPVVPRRFRPSAPSQIVPLPGRRILVGGPPSRLYVVSVGEQEVRPLEVPLSGWGERLVGEMALGPDGMTTMIPWAAGPAWSTQAANDTARTGFVVFEPSSGEVVDRFGPPVPGHDEGRVASLEYQSVIVGWLEDTLVTLNLYSGELELHVRGRTTGAPVRRVALPRGFTPRPPLVLPLPPPSRAILLQYQFRDAALLPSRRMVVTLRHVDYRWLSWNPLLHRPGAWEPIFALELYDLSGRRRGGTLLPRLEFAGVLFDSLAGRLYVYGPGDGVDRTTPIVIGYAIPD